MRNQDVLLIRPLALHLLVCVMTILSFLNISIQNVMKSGFGLFLNMVKGFCHPRIVAQVWYSYIDLQ